VLSLVLCCDDSDLQGWCQIKPSDTTQYWMVSKLTTESETHEY